MFSYFEQTKYNRKREWIFGLLLSGSMHITIFHDVIDTLRSQQSGRHFADHISKCIPRDESYGIVIKISLKLVTKGLIENAWKCVTPGSSTIGCCR